MSKDVMDELANKLGGKKAQRKNYRDIIKELQNSGLNEHQLQKKLNDEVNAISNEAQSLETKSKFKDAAILYYECGIIVKDVSGDDSQSHHQWIEKSSKCLVSLANEYITWNEVDRAAASLSIANLIHFLTGDWVLLPAYNDFNGKYKDQIQQGKTAAQSLWVPYDLVASVTKLNAESLQRAESFAQTALLTQAEPTKTFHEAVQSVLEKAREAMTSQMKLPNIEISSLIPKDIIFGENWSLEMEIQNSGEGFAHNITVTLDKVHGLTLIEGQSYSVYLQELEANSKVQKFLFEFNYPSGEGEKESLIEIKGKVEFFDILENKRINPIGPYPITIRAFKKADELRTTLTKIESNHKNVLDKFKNFASDIESSQSLIKSFNTVFMTLKTDTNLCIDNGEFIKAETRIKLFDVFIQSMASPAAQIILEHDNMAKSITNVKNILENKNKDILENLTKTQNLLSNFEKKWKN